MTKSLTFSDEPRMRRAVRLLVAFLLVSLCSPLLLHGWTKKGKKQKKESGGTDKVSTVKVEATARKNTAKAVKSLAKARTLREKGKAEMALAEFQKTVELDPSCAEAYLEMGSLYFEVDLSQVAIQALETGIPLARQQAFDSGTVSQALCQLAESYRKTGNPSGAMEQAKTASDISPKDPLPWKIMGVVLFETRKPDEAKKALREAVHLDSQFVAAWEQLGQIALERKEESEAQSVYEGLFRCDTFKAERFKASMARMGMKAASPATGGSPPPTAGSADDPYAVEGVSVSTPAAHKIPRKIADRKPPTPPPAAPEPPVKVFPVQMVQPKPPKPLPDKGPAAISPPIPPNSPKKPAGSQTSIYRSNKPLTASDTLLSEVMLPGHSEKALTGRPVEKLPPQPEQTPVFAPQESPETVETVPDSSTEPEQAENPAGPDDPYASPDGEPGSEPVAGEGEVSDDPPLPPDGTEEGADPALPMLPDDEAPSQPSSLKDSTPVSPKAQMETPSTISAQPPRVEMPGDGVRLSSDTATEEIPEDRLFALFSNLASPDADVAANAKKRLAGFGSAVTPHLVKKLSDQNSLFRIRILQTLEQIGPPAKSATADIKKLSQTDTDSKVRQVAEQLFQKLSTALP